MKKRLPLKITNCTVGTGGSKTPFRLRHNQNVRIWVDEDVIEGITDDEFLEKLRYRAHPYISSDGSDFIVTNSSKVIRK